MKFFRRFFYLVYYLKETDFRQLLSFAKHASSKTNRGKMFILADALASAFKYNVSYKDYFCFRFYQQNASERKLWAGTGFMYEYQLLMNPKGKRELLENKILFLNHFKQFVSREFYSREQLKKQPQLASKILSNPSGRMVLKGSHGQVGAEVEVISCSHYTPSGLLDYMRLKNYDLAEAYVIQHHSLMELSPSGLNTVRIFTQLHNGRTDILGARLRVSVNSPVDNMAAGNPAAPVDLKTGTVNGPGVYSNITKEDASVHPVTLKPILGFEIPHWGAVLNLAKDAALLTPENKSIGWDIAITENGPELIEGNHNWCKLLWQLPVKKGLKSELVKYLQ